MERLLIWSFFTVIIINNYGEEYRRESKCSCVEIADDKCWCCIVTISENAGRRNFRNWQEIGKIEQRKKDKSVTSASCKVRVGELSFC